MKKLMMIAAAAAMLAGCEGVNGKKNDLTAVSPDGRNAIRLYACEKGLAYEVARNGGVVVAKTPIGLKVDGRCLAKGARVKSVESAPVVGKVATPVYKKSGVDLSRGETFVDFGDWGVRLVARNDGVAYRFETKFPGKVTVDCEKASVTVPAKDARCWAYRTGGFGQEESVPEGLPVRDLKVTGASGGNWMGNGMVYLPFAYSVGGTFVAVTESDVRDYPVWNLVNAPATSDGVAFDAKFAGWPKKTQRVGGWGKVICEKGGRWVKVLEHEDFLTKTDGTRTFPWRTFVLADAPAKVCEADIVYALAAPQAEGDFSWVKPGKVAWDWWNCFDNQGDAGCNTKTYERFVDFAAKTGVEYVILDEGWSESLNIWKFHPNVDVLRIIDYANKKGVGIILWMAWAQVYGDEEHVAEHFAKLGAKGFKVDFMDRGDAECANFLEKFAAACAKHKMLIDYHGAYRPVGLHRKYPNVLNYEGIHGLEQLKWFDGKEKEMMFNDVCAVFLRLTAGPMDYTPGAMLNHAIGSGYRGDKLRPGSVGTRCRQMAMMVLYEAPLQMLCDSPTNYEKNMECFKFMAETPVVWDDTVGLKGDPDTMCACARRKGDVWYAAAMTNADARDYTLDTSFLGDGMWNAEIFRDADDADANPTHYVHGLAKNTTIRAGGGMTFRLAKGGGIVVRFTK